MQESRALAMTFTRLWGIAIVSALAVTPGYADPVVSWAPSSMAVTLAPNTATSVTYRLAITEDITRAQMRVTPSLVKYLKVAPTNVSNLQSGQWVDVTVTLSLPIDAAPDPISGTLQLRMLDGSGKLGGALSKPLPVTVNVQCPCLPPDPGDAGKRTLEGVDTDLDGVRDDIQRWIAIDNPTSERARRALGQTARTLAGTVSRDLTAESANAISSATGRALACTQFAFGAPYSDEWYEKIMALEAEFMNTTERWRAYRYYNSLLAGRTGQSTPLSVLDRDCDFDVLSLPD